MSNKRSNPHLTLGSRSTIKVGHFNDLAPDPIVNSNPNLDTTLESNFGLNVCRMSIDQQLSHCTLVDKADKTFNVHVYNMCPSAHNTKHCHSWNKLSQDSTMLLRKL